MFEGCQWHKLHNQMNMSRFCIFFSVWILTRINYPSVTHWFMDHFEVSLFRLSSKLFDKRELEKLGLKSVTCRHGRHQSQVYESHYHFNVRVLSFSFHRALFYSFKSTGFRFFFVGELSRLDGIFCYLLSSIPPSEPLNWKDSIFFRQRVERKKSFHASTKSRGWLQCV